MRTLRIPALLAGLAASAAVPVPAWWVRLQVRPSLEARFTQEGESAIFGKVTRTGRLVLAPGGRLRVAYDQGLLLISDGKRLVQYDPDTRSAQWLDLGKALGDAPLLTLLLDPSKVGAHFKVEAAGERVKLVPRSPGLPALEAEGRGDWPERFSWVDATGARQVLRLEQPKGATAGPDTFRFIAPKGTRWVNP